MEATTESHCEIRQRWDPFLRQTKRSEIRGHSAAEFHTKIRIAVDSVLDLRKATGECELSTEQEGGRTASGCFLDARSDDAEGVGGC